MSLTRINVIHTWADTQAEDEAHEACVRKQGCTYTQHDAVSTTTETYKYNVCEQGCCMYSYFTHWDM